MEEKKLNYIRIFLPTGFGAVCYPLEPSSFSKCSIDPMAIALVHHLRMMANDNSDVCNLIITRGLLVGLHTNAGCSKSSFFLILRIEKVKIEFKPNKIFKL
jgi:hypothetical protein